MPEAGWRAAVGPSLSISVSLRLGDDMGDLLSKLDQMEVSQGRPVFRLISELSPDIEEAMSRGFSRRQIVLGLGELGIEISEATLSKYLFRIRRRSAGT